MGKTILDTLMKEYFSDKEIFASFFNGVLKDKIDGIKPENPVEMNTENIDNFIKDKSIQNIVR